MENIKKEEKGIHFAGGKSYWLSLKSDALPFSLVERKMRAVDSANDNLQHFVSLVEKKFDSVWYIGTDYIGEELFERFMFHHGGFMEISLSGEIRCYLFEDKREHLKEAIAFAVEKMIHSVRARSILSKIRTGERLISLQDSITGGKR